MMENAQLWGLIGIIVSSIGTILVKGWIDKRKVGSDISKSNIEVAMDLTHKMKSFWDETTQKLNLAEQKVIDAENACRDARKSADKFEKMLHKYGCENTDCKQRKKINL